MKPFVSSGTSEHENPPLVHALPQRARSEWATSAGMVSRDPRESVMKLQGWIAELIYGGDAHRLEIDTNIVRISSRASSAFCVGTRDQRWALGVNSKELSWFLGLPWFHIAIKRGSTNLNLVCEHLHIDSLHLPAFCISLRASKPGSFDELSRHSLIDVREAFSATSGRLGKLGDSILRTIDVRATEDESTMNGLLAGRVMTGHTNRSVFRSIKK